MKFLPFLLTGLSIGGISGALGIGGGVLLVPALIWLFHFDQRQAAGISLGVLALPVALPAAWKYYAQGLVQVDDLVAVVCIAGAFVVGSYLTASLVQHIPLPWLRLAFGLVLIGIGVHFLLGGNGEAGSAAYGLVAVALGWLAFLGLRALGRRHLAGPDLGQQIRDAHERGWGEIEYHI
jgi:hypothetical protein